MVMWLATRLSLLKQQNPKKGNDGEVPLARADNSSKLIIYRTRELDCISSKKVYGISVRTTAIYKWVFMVRMLRYRVGQTKTLQSLSFIALGNLIALQAKKCMALVSQQQDPTKAETLLSQQIDSIRNYLECNMPGIFHDTLAVEAILALKNLMAVTKQFQRRKKESSYVIGRMVETLYTKNLTKLELEFDDEEMFPTSLCKKSYLLSGLVHLNLGLYCGVDEANIFHLLKELHNLKHLSLVDYEFISTIKCKDNILRCIADNCKLIEVLEFTDSNVNDSSINIIVQLRNLRSITIGESEVSEIGIAKLLLSCENLEFIHVTDTNAIAHALEDIKYSEKNCKKHFKLKFYENFYGTTERQMKLIVKMCPLIQKMTLINCEGNLLPLPVINPLYDLRELHLTGYKFYTHKVKEVLEVRGFNLEHLHLHLAGEINLNTLMYIGQMCPNLQRLCVEQCGLVTEPLEDVFQCKIKVSDSEIPPFRNLKNLSLTSSELDSKSSNEHILFILSNCLNIEMIYIDDNILLTDDMMLKVLERNPLSHLKELWLKNYNLSELIIDQIIENANRGLIVAM